MKRMTSETLAQEYPELHEEIFEGGKTAMYQTVMQQFAELKDACGDDAALLVESFAAGRTVSQTQRVRIEKLSRIARDQAAAIRAVEKPNSTVNTYAGDSEGQHDD
jgi:hypothetical protein